jgi:Na+/H+ antiporter NhaA
MQPSTHHPPASALRNLLSHEATGGLILIASAAAALGKYVLGLSVLH